MWPIFNKNKPFSAKLEYANTIRNYDTGSSAANLVNGYCMVVWKHIDCFYRYNTINAQIFDSARLKIGPKIIVAYSESDSYDFPKVTGLGNGFLVEWVATNLENSTIHVEGSYFNETGIFIKKMRQKDTTNDDDYSVPSLSP